MSWNCILMTSTSLAYPDTTPDLVRRGSARKPSTTWNYSFLPAHYKAVTSRRRTLLFRKEYKLWWGLSISRNCLLWPACLKTVAGRNEQVVSLCPSSIISVYWASCRSTTVVWTNLRCLDVVSRSLQLSLKSCNGICCCLLLQKLLNSAW